MEKNFNTTHVVIPLVIALGTIILLFLLFSFRGFFPPGHNAEVKNGQLDLTNWSFTDDGNVRLDGEWEFYWDQILMPEEFAEGTQTMTGAYPVPLYWTKYKGLNLPSKGDATYRLVVKTTGQDDYLAISLPELYTEYALYINGGLLVGNGKLGGTSFRFLDPDAYMFETGGDRIEIVLQIHNHTHVNAGIAQSILLGTTDNIFWKDNVETAVDLTTVGICLFAGMYHFFLFLSRNKDYKLLCFSIFCAAVAIRGLISNVTYIMEFFPELPFAIGSRILTETIPILTVTILHYIYFAFRGYISKPVFQVLAAISDIYILIIAFADIYTYSKLFYFYLFITIIICIIGTYVAIRAILDKNKEAVLYLAGTLFIVAGGVNDSMIYLQRLSNGYRLGVGLAIFVIIQSYIMAMQYTRFASEREQLYDKLHETDLSFMQAQIKPHFIYNALSAISYMVGTDPKKAKGLILDFSDYLRGCFDFSNTSGLTTLSKEMETVRSYLSIEKARFQGRLNVEYEIEENLQVLIPILSIQPLVENAIRHGIMPRAEGGSIKIKVWNLKGDTYIRVEDDGEGIPEARILDIFSNNTSSTGLTNINGRLKLKFGTELKVTSKPKEGTTVEFIVPKDPKPTSELF